MKKIVFFLSILILNFMVYKCDDRADVDIGKKWGNKEKIIVNIGNQKKELVFTFDVIRDGVAERVWKNVKSKIKLKIGSIDNTTLLFPGKIKIDSQNNIYILDYMDYSVKIFDSTGNYKGRYGKKGQGPGEITTPFDFDINNKGDVVLLGLNDNKFIVFRKDYVKDIKCKLMPMKICYINSNDVVTFQIQDPISQSPFQKQNLVDETITNYQNILSKENFEGNNYGILPFLIGDIHSFNNSEMVYLSSVYGYVVLYNKDGKIHKAFKLINKSNIDFSTQKNIYRKQDELSMIAFPKQEDYLFESSNIYGDDLFIYVNPVLSNYSKNIIDVYSISKGVYKYSFLLPSNDKLIATFLTDNKIYVAKENTEVLVFDYSIEN